jgi:hypothetical protein
MESAGEYHGIVIDLSQKMRSVFGELEIIGRRRFFFNTMSLLKLRVSADALEPAIAKLQANLRRGLGPFVKAFYFHFYREGELIVVFKDRIFRTEPDRSLWEDMLKYGKSLGIPEHQLDFVPCRFADEEY